MESCVYVGKEEEEGKKEGREYKVLCDDYIVVAVRISYIISK